MRKLLKLLETAKSRMESGEYDAALTAFSGALCCNPNRELKTEIHYQAALCRDQLKEYVRAINDIDTALETAAELDYAGKKHIYELLWTICRKTLDHERLEDLLRLFQKHGEDVKDILVDILHVYQSLNKWNAMAGLLNEFRDVTLDAVCLQRKILCMQNVYRIEEAFLAVREYIDRFGEDKEIFSLLMTLCFHTNDAGRGFEYYKKSVVLNDDPEWRIMVNSLLLGTDLYHGAISDIEFPSIIADMKRDNERLSSGRKFENTLRPFRKIRLGYLSANLTKHPVGFFLLPVMVNTVTDHSFIKCYSMTAPEKIDGTVTPKFMKVANEWADVFGLSDDDVERMFLNDKIDIAFEMMCHTEGNRLQLYARRLAPVQISWIGFPVTTAISAMDYVIVDPCTNPPGAEKYYTEKLLYMPDHYLCHVLEDGPVAKPPAFTRNGYITFACFHNFQKITDRTLGMWRLILDRTENTALKIMGKLPEEKAGRDMIEERFRKNGMPMDRISMLPHGKIDDYFAAYNDVDIMLDTYPFNGATTTFDALKMGRPIITLAGERHVTRVGYSILKKIGFEDLVAFTEDEYVEKAVALATDRDRLLVICRELPGRLINSPLVDQHTFRKNYEVLTRDAWVAHCASIHAYYDYNTDGLPELLEQVVNATVYFVRKLEAGIKPTGALLNEYHSVQKAFYEKLKPVIADENFMHGYGRLVELVGLARRGRDIETLKSALATVGQYLGALKRNEKR